MRADRGLVGGEVAHAIIPTETTKWRVREYIPSDWESVLELGKLHHGDRELADPRYSQWLARCDFANKPTLIVGESLASAEVAGFIWAIPFRAQCNGASGLSYVGCNALVHPSFRRTVLYMPLVKAAAHAAGDGLYSYGFVKPGTLSHYRRVDMHLVTLLPLLVRPLDNAQLVHNRVTHPAMRLALRLGWLVAGKTVYRPRQVNAQTWGLELREESAFDASFDIFWEKVAIKYDTMTVRDRAFLTWRFTNLGFRSYQIQTARAGDDIVGYIVLRLVQFAGVWSGLICDLLVEPGQRGQAAGLLLVNEATKRFADYGMALAGSLMLEHTDEYRVLRRAGYLSCPKQLAPQPFQFIARPTGEIVTHEHLADPTHWFVTMADHDAV
jgi:hypothetical protein